LFDPEPTATESGATAEPAIDLACETLYRFLAAALSEPGSSEWRLLIEPAIQALARDSADLLRIEFGREEVARGFGEMPLESLDVRPVLAALEPSPDDSGLEYSRVFGLAGCRECPPYETEYHPNEDVFFRTQQMADIAGFYRAFGLDATRPHQERADHVRTELEFAGFLLLKKRLAPQEALPGTSGAELAAVCQKARLSFVRDHLSWWTPSFAMALRRKADHGFYPAVATLLAAFVPVERHRLDIPPPQVPFLAKAGERDQESSGCEGCALARS
jgi:TorA maturation chaperone TorD